MEYVLVKFEDLQRLADYAANRAVKGIEDRVGANFKYINRGEMVEKIGRAKLDRLIKTGKLKVFKQGGKSSKVEALRSDFEKVRQSLIL